MATVIICDKCKLKEKYPQFAARLTVPAFDIDVNVCLKCVEPIKQKFQDASAKAEIDEQAANDLANQSIADLLNVFAEAIFSAAHDAAAAKDAAAAAAAKAAGTNTSKPSVPPSFNMKR